MTVTVKKGVAGSVCALCAVIMAYCIQHMIPYGMSGEVEKAKEWFWPVVVCLPVGCVSAVFYYYFRAKDRFDEPYAGADLQALSDFVEQQKQSSQQHPQPPALPKK